MRSPKRMMICWTLFWVCASAAILPAAAFAAEQPIAKLTEISGEVVVKNKGDYGNDPMVGLLLYPGDKVVTRNGEASVTFNDGAVTRIQKNSNLTIEQWEEEEGWFRKIKKIKRRLTLVLGKLTFATGKGSGTQTMLATPTAVCGLRGTAGVISINANGEPYIQFDEGGTSYTIGEFFTGVAPDVSQSVADANAVQKADFLAKAAADQQKNAQAAAAEAQAQAAAAAQKVAALKAAQAADAVAQAEIEAALAAAEAEKAAAEARISQAAASEAAAQAVLTLAQTMQAANPDQSVVQAYSAAAAAARQQLQQARNLKEEAQGGQQTQGQPPAEGTPAPGFDIPESPPVTYVSPT